MKKNIREEKQLNEEEYEWNKKRIAIAGFCAIVLVSIMGIFISTLFSKVTSGKKVLGASDSANVKQVPLPDGLELPTKEKVEKTVDALKIGVAHLTSDNFDTSHSAIAKFVSDIQQLQKGKKNVVDVVCDFFCKKK